MKFGPARPADAIGGVTVHTLRQGSLVLSREIFPSSKT
jgi:molybdenum cofactor cytidylyltransferase